MLGQVKRYCFLRHGQMIIEWQQKIQIALSKCNLIITQIFTPAVLLKVNDQTDKYRDSWILTITVRSVLWHSSAFRIIYILFILNILIQFQFPTTMQYLRLKSFNWIIIHSNNIQGRKNSQIEYMLVIRFHCNRSIGWDEITSIKHLMKYCNSYRFMFVKSLLSRRRFACIDAFLLW